MSISRKTCLAKTKALIRAECANYDLRYCNITHYCFDPQYALKRRCSYFCEEPESCEWFEEAVLPQDKLLELAYEDNFCVHQYVPGEADDKVKTKKCQTPGCTRIFLAAGNRSQYCPKCRDRIRKEKTRERVRKNRAKCNVLEG